MAREENMKIAQTLLSKMGDGTPPQEIAKLFSADLDFEIQGDDGVLPWVGKKRGREAMTEFLTGMGEQTERIKFDIVDVLAGDERAIVLGELETRIKATGKIIAATFALVLTISRGEIGRFQMLEDSYATSVAAH